MRLGEAFRSPWGLLVVMVGLALVVAGTFMPLADTSDIGEAARNTFAERQYVIWVYLAVALTLAAAAALLNMWLAMRVGRTRKDL